MLVLTRKLMEKLFIGDDICVTVVRLEGGQVRLGIDAPREVTVVRAELVPERAAERTRAIGPAIAHTFFCVSDRWSIARVRSHSPLREDLVFGG